MPKTLLYEPSAAVDRIVDSLACAGLQGVNLADLETAAIISALKLCDGNKSHAARLLGVSVRTLQRRLKMESAEALRASEPCVRRLTAVV
jgi:transcriptional regulator of acetoin/glycerol metabolism